MTTASRLPPDEAVEILRRLEPVLGRISGWLWSLDGRAEKLDDRACAVETEVREVKGSIGKLDDRVRAMEGEVCEIKGRVGELPTLIQIVSVMLGIIAILISGTVALSHAFRSLG
jgi:hypothetical protein